MAGPKTEFDADECQALLDIIDKYEGAMDPCQGPDDFTPEEKAALEKLQKAGKSVA